MPLPRPARGIHSRSRRIAHRTDCNSKAVRCRRRGRGAIAALDVAESHPTKLVVDVTCNASDVAHSVAIITAIDALDGFTVRKVSDRKFLMHLGGKIEVTPKVELKHRDDLSRAYTPGVARVCLAIAENPQMPAVSRSSAIRSPPNVAAKAGLVGLTRSVAAYAHRFDRIRINGLNIGWTETPGEDATQRTFHGASDDWVSAAAARLPMGKLGQVSEIAEFVVFLLSDRSGVVTGSVIDWDQNVLGCYD
jgi:hypothetical protein